MNKSLQSGFSLIELLVVVAIIGILAAVGTVGYGNYVSQTKVKVVKSNVENIVSVLGTLNGVEQAGVDQDCETLAQCINSVSLQVNNFKNAYNTSARGLDAISFYNTTPLPTECSLETRGQIYIGYTNIIPPSVVTVMGCQNSTTSYNMTYNWN